MTTTAEATTYIGLTEAKEYVQQMWGLKRSRQTVYNWAVVGIVISGQIVKLDSVIQVGHWYTTREWVNRFMRATESR